MHLTAILQDFPIGALIGAQIELFAAELRREVLIVHLGRTIMIVGEDS